jgi:surface protein
MVSVVLSGVSEQQTDQTPSTTIIDDSNIRNFIRSYFNKNKQGLPSDLIEKKIGDWDVSKVSNMRGLFVDRLYFNEPLNDWDVSKVENMEGMFLNCKRFNQPLDKWNVSSVKSMKEMFFYCYTFNQSLNDWDVSKVEKMEGMFLDCKDFNQPLDKWDVSKVKRMEGMFAGCKGFNQPLNNWDVSKVKRMEGMFVDCKEFNQPLDKWDVSKVENMKGMFTGCKGFNQSLNDWDVRNVENMASMFSGCENFNEPLDKWDVRNVKNTSIMFYNCRNFNQPLTHWKIGDDTKTDNMFEGCPISEGNKPTLSLPVVKEIRKIVQNIINNQKIIIPRYKGSPLELNVEFNDLYDLTYDDDSNPVPNIDSNVKGVKNVEEFLKLNENNIVFLFQNKFHFTNKEFIQKTLNDEQYIKYGCKEAKGTVGPNNVINEPTIMLKPIGILAGEGLISMIQAVYILQKKNSSRFFNIKEPGKRFESTVSLAVLNGRENSWVSGSHCQEGQADTLHELEEITLEEVASEEMGSEETKLPETMGGKKTKKSKPLKNARKSRKMRKSRRSKKH